MHANEFLLAWLADQDGGGEFLDPRGFQLALINPEILGTEGIRLGRLGGRWILGTEGISLGRLGGGWIWFAHNSSHKTAVCCVSNLRQPKAGLVATVLSCRT